MCLPVVPVGNKYVNKVFFSISVGLCNFSYFKEVLEIDMQSMLYERVEQSSYNRCFSFMFFIYSLIDFAL